MQVNPLLSNEVSGFDVNDEAKNENYTKELNILYNEINEDLQKADITGTGHVSEEELLDYLQKKLPQNKQLNVILFKQLLQDIEHNNDMNIDLNDFCKKYIQAHEELKLNFETLKKGFDKEKSLKNELESKIQEVKQEKLNKNGISPNACVSTVIGKITFLTQINTDQVYCVVKLDENDEKRTSVKNVDNPNFIEKFNFPIEDKQSTLSYKLFSVNSNQFIGGTDVPLYIINLENEEVNPDFELKDDNDQTVGVFKPKIIIVTSYYDMYQKQYDNIEKNIDSYQTRIAQLSETLAEISLPYKKQFDDCHERTLKHAEEIAGNDEMIKNIEGALKGAFGKKEISWDNIFKLVIYFCIFTQLFTSFTKPDFISLLIEIALAIIINTGMTNYLYDYYKIFFFGILIGIFYDLFDFFFINNISISSMKSVNTTVKIFGFLGFLGKIALLLTTHVIKKKHGKIIPSNE